MDDVITFSAGSSGLLFSPPFVRVFAAPDDSAERCMANLYMHTGLFNNDNKSV